MSERPAGAPAAVRVRGLAVRRRGNLVLDRLDLDIRQGRITGLIGPSGCGKSTLMRAIAGVQRIESGTVDVLGFAAGSAQARRVVGYMTQGASIYMDLTVIENVRYLAIVAGAAESEVTSVVDVVGLGPEAHALVGKLSGGQRARVSLACTMLGRPQLLVLDEPTVGLDPVLRQELWATFHSLAAEGTTLVVSTHVMDEAERCDELILMRDGRVLASESPGELMRRTGASGIEDAFLGLVREQSEG